MLIVACVLHAAMVVTWFLAATWVPVNSLRWMVLAVALPVALTGHFSLRRRVASAAVQAPLLALLAYGLLIAIPSKAPSLAFAKCLTFWATAFACLHGSAAWVELAGRDAIFSAWRWVWRAFLAYSVVAVVLGLWRKGSEGLYGPTGNPNMYGSLLASLGLVLLVPESGPTRSRIAFWAECGIGLALLLATRSRACFAGVGAAVLVRLFLTGGSRRWVGAALVIACVGGVLVFRPEATSRAVSDAAEGSTLEDVTSTRTKLWVESWDAMLAGMPFGFGWGVKERAPAEWTFDVKTLGYGREEGTSWLPIGEELGIPGLILVAWLWIRLGRGVPGLPRRNRVLAGAVVTLFAMLATFEGWFLSPGNWETMAFWTAIGVLFAHPAPALLPSGVASFPSPASTAASSSQVAAPA